jgi:ArsR family transcriptional regulator
VRPRAAARRTDLDRAARILKTVAHPVRLRIVALLCLGEERVGAMAVRLGTSATTVSQALGVLRHERLVAVAQRHRWTSYRLEEGALRALLPCLERLGAEPPRARSASPRR